MYAGSKREAEICGELPMTIVTAIVSLLFSAWLVRQMMAQTTATIAAINALGQELRGRPCFYREAELDRQRHHPTA